MSFGLCVVVGLMCSFDVAGSEVEGGDLCLYVTGLRLLEPGAARVRIRVSQHIVGRDQRDQREREREARGEGSITTSSPDTVCVCNVDLFVSPYEISLWSL